LSGRCLDLKNAGLDLDSSLNLDNSFASIELDRRLNLYLTSTASTSTSAAALASPDHPESTFSLGSFVTPLAFVIFVAC
jgi:hypothetical protein